MAKILLVEDEESVLLLYKQELEERGHEVLCAGDGRPAGGIGRVQCPDQVILNTGYSEYQDSFMSWAADAYVLKSADIEPLVEAVENALRKKGSAQAD